VQRQNTIGIGWLALAAGAFVHARSRPDTRAELERCGPPKCWVAEARDAVPATSNYAAKRVPDWQFDHEAATRALGASSMTHDLPRSAAGLPAGGARPARCIEYASTQGNAIAHVNVAAASSIAGAYRALDPATRRNLEISGDDTRRARADAAVAAGHLLHQHGEPPAASHAPPSAARPRVH
jgi:DNA mismatch repair ATPase MutS